MDKAVPRHRLNTHNSTLHSSRVVLDATPRTRRPGRHRATPCTNTRTAVRAGALVAFVGAVGLTGGNAAQASAQPAPQLPIPSNVALPENLKLPADLVLPPEIDGLVRDVLPPEIDGLVRDVLPPSVFTPGNPGIRKAVKPVSGTVTSGYGPRWGTNHNGVDIANEIGTPIYAVTDGVVLESGPASGFGQWVRVQQDDGTIGVFGHVDQSFVRAGQKVRAGEQIATVGNRGQSTGPHLHYEVWDANGNKINPQVWLNKRGVHP
ncbi:M23 family metallopeptidase [Gordonia sp. zg691]|uniref:M23 family metallopeptidase n=1 Tax=Gordonia jinghuaiqii TaxID=2758710 RepID=A0A7D7QVH3_9ACTN|nr:M23 family metallopeptidase [Gordonia jinghuaiqii]MBD0862477.1 M23 family metallopeptidase [Gordonia jinghuaiqii]MCR5976578.1 peptidoglycan DD-metalloendopeptidase family protein [Gordonia jinghuaiqii]QMS99767.1 M23 family metallopeptidase [Gordonia jinghuaiqii]